MSDTQPLDSSKAAGRLMLSVIAPVGQVECEAILDIVIVMFLASSGNGWVTLDCTDGHYTARWRMRGGCH